MFHLERVDSLSFLQKYQKAPEHFVGGDSGLAPSQTLIREELRDEGQRGAPEEHHGPTHGHGPTRSIGTRVGVRRHGDHLGVGHGSTGWILLEAQSGPDAGVARVDVDVRHGIIPAHHGVLHEAVEVVVRRAEVRSVDHEHVRVVTDGVFQRGEEVSGWTRDGHGVVRAVGHRGASPAGGREVWESLEVALGVRRVRDEDGGWAFAALGDAVDAPEPVLERRHAIYGKEARLASIPGLDQRLEGCVAG